MPILVSLDHGFVGLPGVPVVANDVIGCLARSIELFHCEFLLVVELHVFGALNQCLQCVCLALERLVDRIIGTLEDADVLVDCSVVLGLDGNDDEEAELLLQHVGFAGSTKFLSAEVAEQGVNHASADRDAHDT